MNTLHFAAPLIIALFAFSAYAQQGPAGVPGVVELLIESVTPVIASEPLPPPPSQSPAPPAPIAVTEPANLQEMTATVANAAKPAIRAKKPRKPVIEDCSKTSDPARCQLYQKARKTCQTLFADAHRQCLRKVLTSPQ